MVRRYVFDTSALVKLYVVEADSTTVRDMMRGAVAPTASTEVIVCDLALPETIAALKQIVRSRTAARRGFSPAAFRRAVPQVWDDLTSGTPLLVVPASEYVHSAARIVERRELRAPDAVHVATALGVEPPVIFVSGDVEQCRAARAEGLDVIELAA
jgi:predicted nucleic acid-binding protein